MDKKFNVCGIDFHEKDVDTETTVLMSDDNQDGFYQLTYYPKQTDVCWRATAVKNDGSIKGFLGRSAEHALCKALSDADKRQMKDGFYVEIDNDGEAFIHPGDAQEIDNCLGGTSYGNWFEFTLDSPYISLFIDGMEFRYDPESHIWENAYIPGIFVSYTYEKDPDCCYKYKNQRYTVTDAISKTAQETVYKDILPENVTKAIDELFSTVNNPVFWA